MIGSTKASSTTPPRTATAPTCARKPWGGPARSGRASGRRRRTRSPSCAGRRLGRRRRRHDVRERLMRGGEKGVRMWSWSRSAPANEGRDSSFCKKGDILGSRHLQARSPMHQTESFRLDAMPVAIALVEYECFESRVDVNLVAADYRTLRRLYPNYASQIVIA